MYIRCMDGFKTIDELIEFLSVGYGEDVAKGVKTVFNILNKISSKKVNSDEKELVFCEEEIDNILVYYSPIYPIDKITFTPEIMRELYNTNTTVEILEGRRIVFSIPK